MLEIGKTYIAADDIHCFYHKEGISGSRLSKDSCFLLLDYEIEKENGFEVFVGKILNNDKILILEIYLSDFRSLCLEIKE